MIGQVVKIFSDFYYVNTDQGIIEAKLRGVIKKRIEDVFTGDIVELEQVNVVVKQGFICDVKERKTYLTRPKVANITKVLIVTALKEPDLNIEQIDRYIAHCEYHKLDIVLCFNKEDITETDELKQKIRDIYEPLGYKLLFTSAKELTGIKELKEELKNNVTVLCGASGVGKSTLINDLSGTETLRTGKVSEKSKHGQHTTRHCELISVDNNTYVLDTPGFSQLKFDFLLSQDIKNLFVEFKGRYGECKYKNCLHQGENGCAFIDIVNNMSKTRYESYKTFVKEAKNYEKRISKESIKEETLSKHNGKRIITKISSKKRVLTRKTMKQKIYKEDLRDEQI